MTADALSSPQRRPGAAAPHRIAILALDGVSAMDLGVPVQVFGAESNTPSAATGSAATR